MASSFTFTEIAREFNLPIGDLWLMADSYRRTACSEWPTVFTTQATLRVHHELNGINRGAFAVRFLNAIIARGWA